MSKVHSGYLLLLTLVFSTAHAPTFQLWKDLAGASGLPEGLGAAAFGSGRAAAFDPNELTAAAPREYAEDGDIKRFQLDELYLPKLDVSLPELFDWSAIDRAYLADAAIPDDSGLALDSTQPAPFRLASFGSTYAFAAGGHIGGGAGAGIGSGAPIGSGGVGDAGTDPSSAGQSGKGGSSGSNGTETLPADSNGDTQLPGNSNGGTQLPGSGTPADPIQDPKPVPVPAPGALGLVALGLAGLRLAGRNKNRSG